MSNLCVYERMFWFTLDPLQAERRNEVN